LQFEDTVVKAVIVAAWLRGSLLDFALCRLLCWEGRAPVLRRLLSLAEKLFWLKPSTSSLGFQ